ncbi:MAG: hypothetical protein ACRCUH_00325, partial [Shewanella sp.]
VAAGRVDTLKDGTGITLLGLTTDTDTTTILTQGECCQAFEKGASACHLPNIPTLKQAAVGKTSTFIQHLS